jgi:hypothetical protein
VYDSSQLPTRFGETEHAPFYIRIMPVCIYCDPAKCWNPSLIIILHISPMIIGSLFIFADDSNPEYFTLFLLIVEDILMKIHLTTFSFCFFFLFVIAQCILLFTVSKVLTCLKTHGGIDFSLILQAVKCHPPSSAR